MKKVILWMIIVMLALATMLLMFWALEVYDYRAAIAVFASALAMCGIYGALEGIDELDAQRPRILRVKAKVEARCGDCGAEFTKYLLDDEHTADLGNCPFCGGKLESEVKERA